MTVDDSVVIKAMLATIIGRKPEKYQIVASAKNGEDALFQLKVKKEIDVIIMDVEMPKMNGLEALKEIMGGDNPKPVIMFSSLTGNDAKETIEALNIGAIDVLQKPTKQISLVELQEEIFSKIDVAYKAKEKIKKPMRFITHSNRVEKKEVREKLTEKNIDLEKIKNLVLIGVSAGGPKSLIEVIKTVPRYVDASFLIVQHMPKGYTKMMAEHLNGICKINVKETENGEKMKNNTIYIAKAGHHIHLEQIHNDIFLSFGEKNDVEKHTPSVNQMFKSAATIKNKNILALVMTGMGDDGSEGAKYLKERNSSVKFFAQDEETCVVYGMPNKLKKAIPETKDVSLYKIIEEIEKNLR